MQSLELYRVGSFGAACSAKDPSRFDPLRKGFWGIYMLYDHELWSLLLVLSMEDETLPPFCNRDHSGVERLVHSAEAKRGVHSLPCLTSVKI